jgi:hypothetical protein
MLRDMDQNQRSAFASMSDGDNNLRDRVDQEKVYGLAAVLIGLSQVPLALAFPAQSWLPSVIILSGGSLLVGIGISAYLGNGIFQGGGWDSEQANWMYAVGMLAFAIGVVAATVWISVT